MSLSNENKCKVAAVWSSSFLLGHQLNRVIIKKQMSAIVPAGVALYLTIGLASQAVNGIKAQYQPELK